MFKSKFIVIITLLAIFIACLTASMETINNYITYKKGEIFDINTLTAEEFKKNMAVGGDIYCLLDCIAEEYYTTNNIKTSKKNSAQFYLLPVGENEFTVIEVSSKDFDVMDRLTDESFAYYFSEESDTLPQGVTISGKMVPIDNDIKGYMIEWFQETELLGTTKSDEIEKTFLPYMIKNINWAIVPKQSALAVTLITVSFLALAGYIIFLIVHMKAAAGNRFDLNMESEEYNQKFESQNFNYKPTDFGGDQR